MALIFSWSRIQIAGKKNVAFTNGFKLQSFGELELKNLYCFGKCDFIFPRHIKMPFLVFQFVRPLTFFPFAVPLSQSSSEPNIKCWLLSTNCHAAMMMVSRLRTLARWGLSISQVRAWGLMSSGCWTTFGSTKDVSFIDVSGRAPHIKVYHVHIHTQSHIKCSNW